MKKNSIFAKKKLKNIKMNTEVIIAIIGAASTATSFFLTRYFDKKKHKEEVNALKIDNQGKYIDVYQDAIEGLRKELEMVRNDNASYKEENDKFRQRNSDLLEKNNELRMENSKLTIEANRLREENNRLLELNNELLKENNKFKQILDTPKKTTKKTSKNGRADDACKGK
jgi:predicted RNase H-like nuclease (RuvC/YqgF family)